MMGIVRFIQDKIVGNKRFRLITSKIYFKISRNKIKIRGQGNKIIRQGSFIKKVNVQIYGQNNTIIFKDLSRINNFEIFIKGNNSEITIDEMCLIEKGRVWIEDNNNRLFIGKKTRIVDAYFAIMEYGKSIIIGEECMLSYGIQFRCSDSHSILEEGTQKRINYAKNIRVGRKVWIGADVVVLKGVSIENNSVIGIRSLVTKNVQKNSLAVGVPARIVRSGIDWDWRRLYSDDLTNN